MKGRHAALLAVVLAALIAAPAGGQSSNPQCSDGIDNDGDSLIDYPLDLDCTGLDDETEAPEPPPPPPPPQCSDGEDNDADGKVDEADPGCSGAMDDSEAPDPPPACDDNVDNDGDDLIDYPNDPGCAGAADDSEAPNPECSDGVDNDGDAAVDYPADAGCTGVRDVGEVGDPTLPSRPTLTFVTPEFSHAEAGTVYVNKGETGQFTVDANSANAEGVKFRSPSGAVRRTTPPFESTYALDRVEVGEHTVTPFIVVNGSERDGPSASFSVVSDVTGPDPVAGFVNYPDGNVAASGGGPVSVTVSWAPGPDADSGLQRGSGVLQRQTVDLVGATCDFTAATWVQVTTSGTEGSLSEVVGVGKCTRYRYRISDNVGNETIYAPAFVARNDPGDVRPPGPVRNARISSGDHWVKLVYGLPFAPDFKHVKIYRWIAGLKRETRGTLFVGTRTTVVDRAVFNGTRYVYEIVTCDTSDNCGSPGVVKWTTPRSRYLLSPRDGAVVTSPPRLRWRERVRAVLYNVKLQRRGNTVLSAFPRDEALQLRSRWSYKGHVRRLVDDRYYWYVYARVSGRWVFLGWSRFTKQ